MLETLKKPARETERPAPNRTGIPDRMKERFETVSGLSLDDVRIHYRSGLPAELGALAYTQGTQVFVGPGQERHLPHELGHVVQQKQGLVRPTCMIGGLPVNDEPALEAAADRGNFAHGAARAQSPVVQGMFIRLSNGQIQDEDTQVIYDYHGHNLLGNAFLYRSPDGAYREVQAYEIRDAGFEYSLATDPTATPFFGDSDALTFGWNGAQLELAGQTPRASDIREEAIRFPETRTGAGLHEVLPTNMSGSIAAMEDEDDRQVAAGIQAGFRLATDLTYFADTHGNVAGHSAAMPNPNGHGSTNTHGQAAAHDVMREHIRTASFADPTQAVVETAGAFLPTLANGTQIMEADSLTGGTPNLQGAEAFGPPNDLSRVPIAQIVNEGREDLKLRVNQISDSAGLNRCTSPERPKLDDSGQPMPSVWDSDAGRPVDPQTMEPFRSMPPLPTFPSSGDPFQYAADLSGFVTQPMRHTMTWTPAEDQTIRAFVAAYGPGHWTELSEQLPPHTPRQCRERWHNYLNPEISHEPFTQEEDELILSLHARLGNRWDAIARSFPGRSANAVKNRWLAHLRHRKAAAPDLL